MVRTISKPLKRSIIVITFLFITFLCFVLSILTYYTFSSSIYRSYNKRMLDILTYVESHIDIEDLSRCVDTLEESEKYVELGKFMDSIMEDFDIHYLYIVDPTPNGDRIDMVNIYSADTVYGRETDPDGYYLGYEQPDEYDYETAKLYLECTAKDEVSYFKNFTYWGYDYTALMPLINGRGEHFAALCVDIEVEAVQNAIKNFTAINVCLIVFLGMVFITFFLLWMNQNITEPIIKLEKSVVSFADKSHGKPDIEKLKYVDPQIHTKNEVESLSNAINQMAFDMKEYVKSILDAEDVVEDMKSQVSHMDMLAYQDALTHVKNKTWYDKTEERVNEDIAAGNARFGILMADLNNLKKINDTYGHEHGNDYIFGACHMICIIFDHSPVFRIGGDEFVVLLENRDYDNREKLVEDLRKAFEVASSDETKEPWERYSSAFGLATYDSTTDKCMNDVFKRADDQMYQNKQVSKMARE